MDEWLTGAFHIFFGFDLGLFSRVYPDATYTEIAYCYIPYHFPYSLRNSSIDVAVINSFGSLCA